MSNEHNPTVFGPDRNKKSITPMGASRKRMINNDMLSSLDQGDSRNLNIGTSLGFLKPSDKIENNHVKGIHDD